MTAYLSAHWPLAIFAGAYVLAAGVLLWELWRAVGYVYDEGGDDGEA